MASVPPGWYPDPSGTSTWRWWDGLQWTEHLHPVPGPAQPHLGPAPAPWAAGAADPLLVARRAEDRAWLLAGWSVWVFAAATILQNAVLLAAGSSFRHQLHQLFTEAQHNQPTQNTINQLSVPAWVNLFDLLIIPAAVLFLIWQYRACKVARFRGYPTRISAGLGVGGWFIPVVNFWFPYLAMRDCLPPSHPLRPLGIWAWLSYLAGSLLIGTSVVVSIFSTGGAVIPLAIGSVAWVGAATLGTRLMRAIRDDHQGTGDRTTVGQLAG